MVSCILALVCGAVILVVDQLTKYLISSNMVLGESKPFIDGFMNITYIHNTGGAWGLLSGYTWVLLSLTVIVMLICVTLLLKTGIKNKLLFWAMTLVIFGGIGNLIDRLFRDGNVVDFLHFEFIPTFPVFNIADISVVAGSGLLILYFIVDTVKETKKAKAATLKNGEADNEDN